MKLDQFWKIVADACHSDPESAETWNANLTQALISLTENEIVQWHAIFEDLATRAYRADLWAAAYLINGGASDDGFYYFRCWLIGMGETVYNNAVVNPDSLADVVSPTWFAQGIDAEAEIYAAAHSAWMHVTGNGYDADYPVRKELPVLIGEYWNFDDPIEMHRKLPRLATLYEGH